MNVPSRIVRIRWRAIVAIVFLAAALGVTVGLSTSAHDAAFTFTHADLVDACDDNPAMSGLISAGKATIEVRQGAGIAFATSGSKYFICFVSESATGAITDVYERPFPSLAAPLRIMALWSAWKPVGTFLVVHEGPSVSSIGVTVKSRSVKMWTAADGFTIVSIVGRYVPSLVDFSSPTESGQLVVGTVTGFDQAQREVATLPIRVCRGDPVAMGNGCPGKDRQQLPT